MGTSRPYRQMRLSDGSILREFRGDTSPEELVWHQDKSSRKVTVIEGKDWKLQLEEGLPTPLIEGNSYLIPARSWHRIVRGTGPLVISIQERKENMAIRLTETKLRQIIREEAKSLSEMGRYGRYDSAGSYGGYGRSSDYPRGGEDEMYGEEDMDEEIHLFTQEYPHFDEELADTRGEEEKKMLTLSYLQNMNKRNQYGYSDRQLQGFVPKILMYYRGF